MADEQQKDERGFTVVDRRASSAGPEESPAPQEDPTGELPRVDFSSFCLSLGTSALYHLGLIRDPESGEPVGEPNLPIARQTIDTLEMLREKTRNNLDGDEAKLLDGLLYELRMRYVEVGEGGAGPKPGPE